MTPATLARRYRAGPLVAYHESGHVVVGHRLGRRIEKVHLGHARDSGRTDFAPIYDPYQRALVLLAGERAERVSISWLPEFESLASGSDDRRGVDAAMAELGPAYTMAALMAEVDTLLRESWRALDSLARLLDDRRVLDGPEVLAMLG